MTTPPVLYDYYRSSASYRVRIALNLKGLSYTQHVVNLLAGEQRDADNLARNPLGFVPSIAFNGHLLTQSLAIIEYLEETHPNPPLLPHDPIARAHHRALALALAADTHPIQNLHVAQHVQTLIPDDADARKAWMQHFITRGLEGFAALLDREVPAPFASGATPGLVDCCLIPQLYNARRWGVALDRFTRLSETDARCAHLPAFAAAHPDNQPDAPA